MPWARTRNFLVTLYPSPPRMPPPISDFLSNAPTTPGRGTDNWTEVTIAPASTCRLRPVGLVSNAILVVMSGIKLGTPAAAEPSTCGPRVVLIRFAGAPPDGSTTSPAVVCCGLATATAQTKRSLGFQASRNCASREYITPTMMLPSVAIVVSRSEGEAPTPTLFGDNKPQACPAVNSQL